MTEFIDFSIPLTKTEIIPNNKQRELLVFQKRCTCLQFMVDLSHGYGIFRNYICFKCNTHIFKEKFYTKMEWDEWTTTPNQLKLTS